MRLDPIKSPVLEGDLSNLLSLKDLFEALGHNCKDLDYRFNMSIQTAYQPVVT